MRKWSAERFHVELGNWNLDPRADHLYYALWVNRSQPVNAYGMRGPVPGEPRVEQIYPNTRPTIRPEV